MVLGPILIDPDPVAWVGVTSFRKEGNMYFISIYQTYRAFGGHEEGGWYYTAGAKHRDIRIAFQTKEKLKAALTRLRPAIDRDSDRYDVQLQARVYENQVGPDELPVPNYQ